MSKLRSSQGDRHTAPGLAWAASAFLMYCNSATVNLPPAESPAISNALRINTLSQQVPIDFKGIFQCSGIRMLRRQPIFRHHHLGFGGLPDPLPAPDVCSSSRWRTPAMQVKNHTGRAMRSMVQPGHGHLPDLGQDPFENVSGAIPDNAH